MNYKSYIIEQNIKLLNNHMTLFYGENLGLKNDFKKNIKVNNQDVKIITFLQEEILKNENIFFNEILNTSLFDKKKIYFIENVNDKILNIIENIEPKIDDQQIYLFSDLLDKRSKIRSYFEKSKKKIIVACYADNEITIKKIILNKLKGFKGLSAQNINMIIDNSNLDRIKLNNELNKIITYFTNKELNSDKLEILLDLKINDNFNILKDEALKGNKKQTNKLLSDTIIDEEKNVYYLSLINQRLNKLAETFVLEKKMNLEDAINMIKPPIFWKDKPTFFAQTKKWNSSKIQKVLNKTYDLEINIKSNGNVNKNILMKKLLIDICLVANS
jgi:DNA polymerase III subunit delta